MLVLSVLTPNVLARIGKCPNLFLTLSWQGDCQDRDLQNAFCMNRIPGLVMLLFLSAGTVAGMRYGADLTPTVRGIVGAFGGLGLYWVLAGIYLQCRKRV